MPATDQGSLTGRYMLVPRTLIFPTRGDQVLLIRGAAHKRLWANLYNGLGGHIERGEDILSSAERELEEEAGISIPDLQLCGVITIDAGADAGIMIFVLRGECTSGAPRPSIEGVMEWVDRNQVSKLPLVEDLPTLLPRVLDHPRGSAPFAAHYSYNEIGELVMRFHP